MVYFVGVIVPAFGVEVPFGYELSQIARRRVAASVLNLPINVQHAGIQKSVERVLSAGAELEAKAMRADLANAGVVRHGWMCGDGSVWVIFEVAAAFDLVLWLVDGGHLQGLSLTHVDDGGAVTPVEVSLCSVPARDFSFVRYRCDTLEDAFAYKARVTAGGITSVRPTKMEVSDSKSRLAQIVESLPAADRVLVEARFTELCAHADDARLAEQTATTRFNGLVEVKETDKRLFDEQFKYLMELLPDAKSYAVTGDTCKVLKNAEPEVMHHVTQVVKCASAHLASALSGSRKRRAVSEALVLPAKSAADDGAAAAASSMSPLQRAMADTFT